MIPQFLSDFNTQSQDSIALGRKPSTPSGVVTLLRQLHAQADDEALRGDLVGLLTMEAENLKQKLAIDLDAAAVPDDRADGQVCYHCLQRSVDGATHYWDTEQGGPGECERHDEESR